MARPLSRRPVVVSVISLHFTTTDPALAESVPISAVALIMTTPTFVSKASNFVNGGVGQALVSWAKTRSKVAHKQTAALRQSLKSRNAGVCVPLKLFFDRG